MSGESKTQIGRGFMKTSRKGQKILDGETIRINDMHPGERMMLLLDLAEVVKFHASDESFTGRMSNTLFLFLNVNISWQESIVFIKMLKYHMDVSFVDIMDMGQPECAEFARRMRGYLRGTV